jgi:hypothetical protein
VLALCGRRIRVEHVLVRSPRWNLKKSQAAVPELEREIRSAEDQSAYKALFCCAVRFGFVLPKPLEKHHDLTGTVVGRRAKVLQLPDRVSMPLLL